MEPIALTIREQDGIVSETWSPLDILVAHIKVNDKAWLALRAELAAFDGRNRSYFRRSLVLDKDTTSVPFMVAGAAGRQRMELKLSGAKPACVVANFSVKAATTIVSAPAPDYTDFFRALYGLLQNDKSLPTYSIAGKNVHGISWIRDHTHCLKGLKYSETDLKTMVDFFLDNQMPGGGYYDFFHVKPDRTMDLTPDGKAIFYRQDNEADLEYLLVEAAHTVWQATGDDAWMRACLPKLEKGLHYTFNHPNRWSEQYQLLKRPFTIDTWDFEYLEDDLTKSGNQVLIEQNGWLVRMIDGRTKFCIMHGDNSGLMKACRLMATMYGFSGADEKNKFWTEKAEQIRERANQTCWNGQFYTHQVHIDPVNIYPDENRQLSLSNTYDMNRGLPSHQQAASIIREYQRRKESSGSFAEWFSIDPPFPNGTFKGEHPKWRDANEYINGTIMPLVSGELARACFEHGFERYGVDILQRLHALIKRDGKLYFMYNRDGSPWHLRGEPALDEGGPSLWGTTAILHALMEGLAGVEDCHKLYQKVRLSPRWAATEAEDVKVIAAYESSQTYIGYHYRYDRKSNTIIIDVAGSGDEIQFHVLIPEGRKVKTIRDTEGRKIRGESVRVEQGLYMDFIFPISKKQIAIQLAD